MLMLLAKEVAEKQSQFNLQLVNIAVDGLVTICSVFVGACLAYIFTRKSDKKKLLDEQEKTHVKELYDALLDIMSDYIIFLSFARDKASILLNKKDEKKAEKAYGDFLNANNIMMFDFLNLSARFHALLFIRDVKDMPIIFEKLSIDILNNITFIIDTLNVVYEKEDPNDEEYDLLLDEIIKVTSKTNIDIELYHELCYRMQNFILKK